MRGARRLIPLVLLVAALSAACSSNEPRPPAENRNIASPTEMSPRDIVRSKRLDSLLDGSHLLHDGSIDPSFALAIVEYTSPAEAAASFWDCWKHLEDECSTAVMTTRDNWAHAAGIVIPETIADLVDFQPTGDGAVAIKAVDQIAGSSYPPFVLRPDATTELLRVATEARDPTADTVALFGAIGESEWDPGFGRKPWAVDAATAQAYPLKLSPPSCCSSNWLAFAGRPGTMVTYGVYRRRLGDGVWRFASSIDGAHTWRTTDVKLPLGDRAIWNYTDDYYEAVGPGHLQAIAMTSEDQDGPRHLWELWLTDDEREFHRVQLTRMPKDLGGIAFAADGGLLLREATGHRMWRLPPGATDLEPLADPPRLPKTPQGKASWQLFDSGGVIITTNGSRTLAMSIDGSNWTQATPGR